MMERDADLPRTPTDRSRWAFTLSLLVAAACCAASDADRFRVKREGPFEFARKPALTRDGDRVTIAFETKAFCDATVAVENDEGRIVRHLASGVLGPNAPAPFRKNAKGQAVVWDGKNDQGVYLDDTSALRVRVSLGLKPRFERTLYWSPYKRIGLGRNPIVAPQPEGVYVYEGDGVEQVRLFGHDGRYVRTVYPFPAAKVRAVKGLGWHTWPDGYEAPVHIGFWRSTFLTGGVERTDAGPGSAARAFAVQKGRIAMLNHRLSRMATDGSTGGMDLYGPEVSISPPWEKRRYRAKSAALSPDGKWLYFTGFYENTEHRAYGRYGANIYWIHAVYRTAMDRPDTPAVFAGAAAGGRDADHFFMPSSVTCDAEGRVYVADHYNNRIQVFSPDGALVKSLPVDGPSIVQVSPVNGEIYVFSWAMPWSRAFQKQAQRGVAACLRRFKSMDDFRLLAEYPLPFERYRNQTRGGRSDEMPQRAAVDFWTDPPTIWMSLPVPPWTRWGMEERCPRLYQEHEGALKETFRFSKPLKRARIRQRPAPLQRQRLYVDPRDGMLYVAEGDTGVSKAVTRLFQIDPETGRGREVELPVSFEDMAIDHLGRAYLRTTDVICRFDMATWQEVPFDYGQERTTRFSYDARGTHVQGGLVVPSNKPVYWHQSGMDVAPNGDVVVNCVNRVAAVRLRDGKRDVEIGFKPYVPLQYPGRYRYAEVHVYDRYGRIKHKDSIPGIPDGHGTYVDARGNIYVLVAGTARVNDKPFAPLAGSVMKFTPGAGKFLSGGDRVKVRLPREEWPGRTPDLDRHGPMWAQGAQWVYPGIGYVRPGAPCQCWNCRFHVDDFGRVFAPETQRCQVAVLDTNGNLLMHLGRYGNVDDGAPSMGTVPFFGSRAPSSGEATARKRGLSPSSGSGASADAETGTGTSPRLGASPRFRSIGGDEVSLAYACYLATHTDHRLYIADAGNARIVSVKLDYHATERVSLRDVRDGGS